MAINFEVDVFISYAHIDDMPLKEGGKGWVANFHKALEVRLAQLVGEKPRIWRDQKLQGNDFFGDEIVQQFPNTAIMLSIISPRYIKSEWCTKEVKEFHKTASKLSGVKVGNKSRIFKIVKTFVPFETHPSEIADTLGYEFFVSDSSTGKTTELSLMSPAELEQMYWAKLDDIAHDIRDILFKLKEPGAAEVSADDQLSVYLAETTSDLKAQREMLNRQLAEYGYRVLPDTRLPLVEPEFIAAVKDYLNQCALSIHLVGENFGIVPEESTKSVIMLQNELAAQQSKTGKLKRLIWLLAGKPDEGGRQEQFINHLRSNPDAQYGADLFETSIEDFKLAVRSKLKEIQTAAAGKKGFQGISTVYLAEGNKELQGVREKIKQRLIERGCTVLPEERLPLVYEELKESIAGLMEKCDVSIHLLGDHYGLIPEETDKSIAFIQNELAEKRCETGKLERLIWVSPIVDDHTDERQQAFIDLIKSEAAGKPYTVILETPTAEMESTIFEKLEKIEERRAQPGAIEIAPSAAGETDAAPQGPRMIYLICDQGDLDNRENDSLTQVEDFLFDSGFEVTLPLFEGTEEDVMKDHHENLKTCDAVIIYYGAGGQLWLRSITRDLTKIAGYGRTRPLLNKAVFLAPPADREKTRFRSHDLLVIDGLKEFLPASFDPFMEKLK